MGDIEKAIEKEKEYLEYRKQGKEPFHLVDAVKEIGFKSLDDYFKAKAMYEFEHLSFDIIETTPEKAISDVMDCIANKKTAILFTVTPFTLIWNGTNSPFNEVYCEEHQIPVFPLHTGGGTIVSTEGDLNIGICIPKNDRIDVRYFMDGIADILRNFTDNEVIVDGNDVLVGGKKVLGSATYKSNGMFVFITPVSMSEKNDLIDCICIKKSSKFPSHIDFMDANELREEVERWLVTR